MPLSAKRNNSTQKAKYTLGDKVMKPDINGSLKNKKGVICGRCDQTYSNGRVHKRYWVLFDGKSQPEQVTQALLLPSDG